MNKGLFVGSFDPFTIGHDSIVRRALPLYERNQWLSRYMPLLQSLAHQHRDA